MPLLLNEPGEFFLNNPDSPYCTFAYSGDNSFMQRMENLFHNHSILESGEIHRIKDNYYFILTPFDRLERGLKECLRGEIIRDRLSDIDLIFTEIRAEGEVVDYEVSWDELKVADLVQIQFDKFMSKWGREDVKAYQRAQNSVEWFNLGRLD